MKFIDNGNYTKVVDYTTDEILKLKDLLSIKVDSRFYSKAYKRGHWDGVVRFLNTKNQTFPSGLLAIIEKKYNGVTVEKDSPLQFIDWEYQKRLTTVLRDYQIEAVNACLNTNRGLIEMPTGSGKTVVMGGLCAAYAQSRILIMVPTKALMYQTAKSISTAINEPVGLIGNGRMDIKRVTVGIVKSVWNYIKDLENDFDIVILDEAHHASADTFYESLLKFPVHYKYGFSADSLDFHGVRQEPKLKRIRILGAIGPFVYKVSNTRLKDNDILARADIKFVHVDPLVDPELPSDELHDLGYEKSYCKYHCENEKLHDKIIDLCEKHKDESILIITKHIHHGEELSKRILQPNVFLSGEMNSEMVNTRIKEFNNNKFNILVGSPIFSEGVDLPQVDVVINAAGDVAATKQRVGRGLRKKTGKENKVTIYDFFIAGNRHIERHARRRKKILITEGHSVTDEKI